MKRIILLLIIFVLASCRSITERNEECIDAMPLEVRGHVASFLFESEKFDKNLKLKNLRVELVGDLEEHAGFYRTSEHKIYLDTTSTIWRISPESLVYHELGHALLKRGHNNTKIDHGPLGSFNISYMGVPNPYPKNAWYKQIMIEELFTVDL